MSILQKCQSVNNSSSTSDILDSLVLGFEGNLTLNEDNDTWMEGDGDDDNENSSSHQDYLNGGEGCSGSTGTRSTFSLVHHARAKAKMSWEWEHFKAIPDNYAHVLCLLCDQEVFCTLTWSTSMLKRHIKIKHPRMFADALKSSAKKSSFEVQSMHSHSQRNTEGYVVSCPAFADCL